VLKIGPKLLKPLGFDLVVTE